MCVQPRACLDFVQVFPTGIRSFCTGMSAATGKFGGLLAAIIFGQASTWHTLHSKTEERWHAG